MSPSAEQEKLDIPISLSNEELSEKLLSFSNQFVSPINLVKWEFSQQKEVINLLVEFLKDESRTACHVHILQAFKIFTRNKQLFESIINDEILDELLKQAGISNDTSVRKDLTPEKAAKIKEAQRCLSNIYLQCHRAQDFALNNDTLSGIMQQTTMYREYKIPPVIISFDIKILFLITAQRTESRTVVVVEYRALSRLTNILENLLENAKTSSDLSEDEIVAICDILKALFNLTCGYEEKDCDEEETSLLVKICKIIQTLIIVKVSNVDRKTSIVSNCVNLLTNYQGEWTHPLIEPFDKAFATEDLQEVEYDGKNMNAPQILMDFLDHNLTKTDGNKAHGALRENMAPILKVITMLSLTHRNFRKYLRLQILPPIRDVSTRPEVGNTIKNKMCRLLTTPDTRVGSMVAECLFILCKEKVGRFVKHTGYGNAAGLLARRGLMLGERVEAKYSGSDTDSDTEEYCANAHMINPVTGHVEPPRKSPFEGMTEEQKEYEANQLANLIHQLHELGAIKPGKIGPDGKPIAVEHILELTADENSDRITEQNDAEEDSDD